MVRERASFQKHPTAVKTKKHTYGALYRKARSVSDIVNEVNSGDGKINMSSSFRMTSAVRKTH